MKAIVLALVLSAGCANVHVNRATLIASTTALVADWAYTRSAASAGWMCGGRQFEEMGAARGFIGATPNSGAVDAYFGITAIANAVIWAALPARYRSVIPLGIVGVQTHVVAGNAFGPAADCM